MSGPRRRRRFRWRHSDSLPPFVLQLVGLVGLIALGVFWAITARLSPTLLGTTCALVGIGQYVDAVQGLTMRDRSPDTLPAAKAGDRPDGGATF